ncbi:hypothetical protein [Salinisphaera shabanensis]|nr:hypothetical protein [Salinisphaera shabanensis]
MSELSGEELQRAIYPFLQALNDGAELTSSEKRRLSNILEDSYNFIAGALAKPNLFVAAAQEQSRIKAIERERADQAKERETEQRNLDAHKKFVEQTFKNADHYFRGVQLAGYAAFFGLWNLTTSAHHVLATLAALSMLISAVAFITWESARATALSFALRKHAKMSFSTVEEFVDSRKSGWFERFTNSRAIANTRFGFWIAAVIPGSLGLILLASQLVSDLASSL